ncbi:hypothetical protein BHF71_09085 [Vulcanibacillus modesticaldus]|uniref:Uncharacterized protein n=1 Tax=Vulcanibacillus modesticaldus TaxID=337097 RepID=A0A1D2YUX6_9BACI|nr:hypothetical protein [Vulcanibacillus modesticaldus]OEF99455.1 hypothetical protein BHF71_09085 [Vulcanibacillus modesticaldus]
MALKDLVTPEQRKTKTYKILRIYYYFSWLIFIAGIVALFYVFSFLIYKQFWKIPGLYLDSIILLMFPLIPLSGGLYGINKIKMEIHEVDWDEVIKVDSETEEPPWSEIQ